jgi:hypothetical protein
LRLIGPSPRTGELDGVIEALYDADMDVVIEPPFLIVKPFASEEDFYREAGEDSDWEYLDGRIVMHLPASDRHEDLFRFPLTLLSAYLDETTADLVRGSRYPMRLDPRWSPEPDLRVVREAKRDRLTPRRLEGPADLVISRRSRPGPPTLACLREILGAGEDRRSEP